MLKDCLRLFLLVILSVGVVGIYKLKDEIDYTIRDYLYDLKKENLEDKYRYNGFRKDKSFEGFTVINPYVGKFVHLINMSGDVVHTWDIDTERIRLLENCNLLSVRGLPNAGNDDNTIYEFDWDSNIVKKIDAKIKVHHDLHLKEDGSIVFLGRSYLDKKYKKNHPELIDAKVRMDSIHQIDAQGNPLFEWYFSDTYGLDFCGRFSCNHYMDPKTKKVSWTHLNYMDSLGKNPWYQQGHEEFHPDNFLFSSRILSEAYILDRASKKIVWSYSGDYNGGLESVHDAHMIPEGYPGAGNILLLDNGSERLQQQQHPGASYIIELNPVTKEIVWVYDVGIHFYTNFSGSVQRLANGNTLISEDCTGRVFEVTKDQQIVWQYIYNQSARQKSFVNDCSNSSIRIERAYRYSADHCSKLGELALYSD